MCGPRRLAAPGSSLGSFGRASRGGCSGSSGGRAAEPGLGDTMRRVLRLLLGCFLTELCARVCRAQERAGHGQLAQLGGVVVLAGGNRSGAASGEAGEGAGASDAPPTRAPTPDFCRGYFDVMGQWDPPFNCSSGDFIFCCGTCGFRFCCTFKKRRLNQSTCTNYDTPLWLNTGKPPARKDDPLHDPTKDKTNLIVYIICGVVAVMVLVGIFTKLGLEKAHRPQREHMSRALADVMRPQGHCNTDPMERDLNIVVHVQHYENMDTRTPINNLHATQMNNAVPTSPLLQQMGHPHSYPSLGQISNPYEQQPPGKELNKYASLKAVAVDTREVWMAEGACLSSVQELFGGGVTDSMLHSPTDAVVGQRSCLCGGRGGGTVTDSPTSEAAWSQLKNNNHHIKYICRTLITCQTVLRTLRALPHMILTTE
ncbi:protein shisa-9 isoform X3 [Acinonyx jubatus]|uniref:Protein shisa-9 isoform X3 n=1 Tax=Acinonyx jubatus TaxID=32536 RepID=A0ABM3PBI1_ACIJB|nr:protein shisa-9 isoform X3 [Acinonyx jubatus]